MIKRRNRSVPFSPDAKVEAEEDTSGRLRVVIAGGGTGGHVFPALALADQLRETSPGSEIVFVGSEGGMEQRLVPAHGYTLRVQRVGKLRGAGMRAWIRTLAGLPLAITSAIQHLRWLRPQIVVGVGGYASAPVVIAAALLRLPLVILEQNAIPGSTNRMLARLADRVVISFKGAAHYMPSSRTLHLGNPVRAELLRRAAIARGSRPATPGLLVLGGSQGAHRINELIVEAAAEVQARVPGLRIMHQTGAADHVWVARQYQKRGIAAQALPFIEEMGQAYGQADLVLGRSGATTLAELCAIGLPAVLVPYPFAADDHQAANAADLAQAGGARVVRQQELTARGLTDLLAQLLACPATLDQMSRASTSQGKPGAAAAVVRVLHELARPD